jgi:AcrR family transcriptional regulator
MQKRSEETRNRILDASIQLFSEGGFNVTSVDDICTQAGVSKGAFYHHFESKHALFIALLDGWLKNIDNAIEASRGMPVPETFQRIAESCPYIFATAGGNLPMFMEFWLQASRDEEIWQASVAPYRRYHKEFTALIQRGIDDGTFVDTDAELAARMIVSMAMGLLLQSLMDPQGAKWEVVARKITNMALDSLTSGRQGQHGGTIPTTEER